MTRAIIMAGGQGTRLRPYTAVLPKPLMPVGDRPVLDIVVRQLRAAGVARITIATGYLAGLIEAFFRDGSDYDIPIDYFREHEPLGTVGALAHIGGLDAPFLVMNGDVLTDMDYAAFIRDHVAGGAAATIASTRRNVNISLGVMEFGDGDAPERVTGYIEKPTHVYEVSMGVYCLDPRVLGHIEAPLDFPDLILRLLERGERVEAWRPDAYWLDLGRHDDYEKAMDEFESVRHRLLPDE
ncbi:MAG: sugar phosphate nucleotidyltransferase [Actinomycetota bacterium]|nr:sugar phosphate nucleotidyltransferase [Actinomycetota bacterium]